MQHVDDDEAFVDANEVPSSNITLLPLAEEVACLTVDDSQEMTEVIPEPVQVSSRKMSDDNVPNFHAYAVFESTSTAFEEPSNHSEEPAEMDSSSLIGSELEWDTCILVNEGEMLGEINPRDDGRLWCFVEESWSEQSCWNSVGNSVTPFFLLNMILAKLKGDIS